MLITFPKSFRNTALGSRPTDSTSQNKATDRSRHGGTGFTVSHQSTMMSPVLLPLRRLLPPDGSTCLSELGVWPGGGCSVCAEGTDETRLVATGMDVLPELSGGNGALRGSGNCGCHQGPHGHERYAMWAGVDGFARTARWPAGEREVEVQPAPHTFNDPRPLGAFLGTSQAPRARS